LLTNAQGEGFERSFLLFSPTNSGKTRHLKVDLTVYHVYCAEPLHAAFRCRSE